MTAPNVVDVAVVGGGPGGYVAAIRAAQLGLSVMLVEAADLGGVCLNWGCIPTKALLRSAEVLRLVREAGDFGVKAAAPEADLPAMVARSRQVAGKLRDGVGWLLKKNRVQVVRGWASLTGGGGLKIERAGASDLWQARHIILATGARPRLLPGLEEGMPGVWTSKDALVPDILPARLLIIGAGAIGVEFASFFNALGAKVRLADAAARVLPLEDIEISEQVAKTLTADGVECLSGHRFERIEHTPDGLQVRLNADAGARTIACDRVLVAVGIEANTASIGLEHTRVRLERGHVATDGWCRTDEPGVYAIGDCAGPPWLAHKASHEGLVCAEHIAGLAPAPLDRGRIPSAVYGHPLVASVGLTEEQARAQKREVRVGRFPFSANGRSIAQGESSGFVKTLFDAVTGELLGAHIVGGDAPEMIASLVALQSAEGTEAEALSTVFPHPTLSEAIHESMLAAYERGLHA